MAGAWQGLAMGSASVEGRISSRLRLASTTPEARHVITEPPSTKLSDYGKDLQQMRQHNSAASTHHVVFRAQTCLRLLTRLTKSLDRMDASGPPNISIQAEDDLGRFSIWVDNIGLHPRGLTSLERISGWPAALQEELLKFLVELQEAISSGSRLDFL